MTATVSILRQENAGAAELAAIYGLIEMLHAEAGIASLAPEKIRAMIAACLERGAVVIALEDGVIVGTMGLVLSQFWYSEDWFVQEMWTFVHPAHRRSRHAKHLLLQAIEAAHIIGRPLIAAITSNERTEAKCRLWRRHLTPFGAIFMSPVEKAA